MRLEYFIFPLLDVDVVISLRPVARRGVEREVISDSVSTIGPGKIHLHFSRKHPTSIVICGLCGIRNRGSSGAIHRLDRELVVPQPRTLEEVGEHFNLTRERIRQIEARAMSKLRHPSSDTGARDLLTV